MNQVIQKEKKKDFCRDSNDTSGSSPDFYARIFRWSF